jgi:diacylglycerol kinase
MQKTLKSFHDSLKGLKSVLKEERNFKIEILAAAVVLLVVLYFHFQIYEMIPILICIFLVLSAEIINTVVEDVCDKIEPQHDRIIGKIKDMMAAYVLVTVLGSVVVGVLVFYSHFYYQIFVS